MKLTRAQLGKQLNQYIKEEPEQALLFLSKVLEAKKTFDKNSHSTSFPYQVINKMEKVISGMNEFTETDLETTLIFALFCVKDVLESKEQEVTVEYVNCSKIKLYTKEFLSSTGLTMLDQNDWHLTINMSKDCSFKEGQIVTVKQFTNLDGEVVVPVPTDWGVKVLKDGTTQIFSVLTQVQFLALVKQAEKELEEEASSLSISFKSQGKPVTIQATFAEATTPAGTNITYNLTAKEGRVKFKQDLDRFKLFEFKLTEDSKKKITNYYFVNVSSIKFDNKIVDKQSIDIYISGVYDTTLEISFSDHTTNKVSTTYNQTKINTDCSTDSCENWYSSNSKSFTSTKKDTGLEYEELT